MVVCEDSVACMQVELNTISSSFGCLCTLVGQLHHYIMEHQGASEQVLVVLNADMPSCYITVPMNQLYWWNLLSG